MRRTYQIANDLWLKNPVSETNKTAFIMPQKRPVDPFDAEMEKIVTDGLHTLLFGYKIPNEETKKTIQDLYNGKASIYFRKRSAVQQNPWMLTYMLAWWKGTTNKMFSKGQTHSVYYWPSTNPKNTMDINYVDKDMSLMKVTAPSTLYVFYTSSQIPVHIAKGSFVPVTFNISRQGAYALAGHSMPEVIKQPYTTPTRPTSAPTANNESPKKNRPTYVQTLLF